MIATLALISMLLPQEPGSVAWQRSLEDALQVSQETNRPLLICVNMDGESASERFANRKYSDPAFVELTRGFVPLVVSVDRHNPEDFDEHGHRHACPRFGTVTCGEHIALEPIVFAAFFNNERVAPRHIGISIDGSLLFDRKMENNLTLVDRNLREFGNPPAQEIPVPSDPDELLTSRDSRYRMAVEVLYAVSDTAGRLELLRKAAGSDSVPMGLVRLGLKEASPELHLAAIEALGACPTPTGASFVEIELARADTPEMRRSALRALEKLAATQQLARQLWSARQALAQPSRLLDQAAWSDAMRTADAIFVPFDPTTIDSQIEELIGRIRTAPDDGALHLQLAEANLAFAEDRIRVGQDPTFLLEDARISAVRAEQNGATSASAKAVQSRAAWLLGDADAAGVLAVAVLPEMIDRAPTRPVRDLLEIVAMFRTAAIYEAMEAKADWPLDLISDAHVAFTLLASHPFASAEGIANHATLLTFLGARAEAAQLLERGLTRFPGDPGLHEALRARLLTDRGVEALRASYQVVIARSPDPATTSWFAGYGELVIAEIKVDEADGPAAGLAYGRAIDLFERSVADRPEFADSANHYLVLALAGRAAAALDAGDLNRAAADLITALPVRPETLEAADGLQRQPIDILVRVYRALREKGEAELARSLAESLEQAAPHLRNRLDR